MYNYIIHTALRAIFVETGEEFTEDLLFDVQKQ